MFDCRANMSSSYKQDLTSRACRPDPASGLEGHNETKEHLKLCTWYSELWLGLGPMSPLTEARYFMKVKHKKRPKSDSVFS